jgi:competence protein ComEA
LQEKSLKGNNEEVNNLSENQISEKSNYQNNKQNENRNKEKLLNNRTTSSEVNQKQIVELNTADSSLLTTLNGIGPVFATRILKYKNLLGGYYSKNQLLDVYGFSQEKLGLIADFIFVDTTKIVKLDVNNLSFKQILKHPYFDYETTKTIVTEREKTPFTSLNDFIIRTKIESDSLLNYIKFF